MLVSVEQWDECGDLVGLARDLDLSEHDAGVLVDHREQTPAATSPPSRS
jgi:hypothetical protein